MLAERCGYFRTLFAQSSAVTAETLLVGFDFTTAEQMTSFHHLLTFLYTDTCPLLTAGYTCRARCTNDTSASVKTSTSKSKRKANSKDTAGTFENSAVDPVTSLKTMARQLDVKTLVKRFVMLCHLILIPLQMQGRSHVFCFGGDEQ